MEQQVTMKSSVFRRLESHAKGFDTPASVIERILDFYEEHQNCLQDKNQEKSKVNLPVKSFELEVKFFPDGESEFKKVLLEKKLAWIKLYKTDGTSEQKLWKAHDFTEKSNLMGNLRSGYLRGWRDKGICKAVLAIEKSDIS